jgi:hypothetical protein
MITHRRLVLLWALVFAFNATFCVIDDLDNANFVFVLISGVAALVSLLFLVRVSTS